MSLSSSYILCFSLFRHCLKLTEFLNKVSNLFVKRVDRERYRKPVWGYIPAKEHCLSDEDITDFVETIKPAALQSMWSKYGFLDAGFTLQNLAVLRPELILPTLVERLSSSLDVVTEPHKLTASLYSMIVVARPLVTFSKFYPQGQLSVLPLLFSTLPGKVPGVVSKSVLKCQAVLFKQYFLSFLFKRETLVGQDVGINY